MRKWVLAACMVAALLPAVAEAKTPPEGWGAAELQVAQEYWGTASPPKCASTTIVNEDDPLWNSAAATVPTQPGTNCQMWLPPNLSVYFGCRLEVHEYGHWMGEPWTTDPKSIMFDGVTPGVLGGANWEPPVIKGCKQLVSRWLGAAAVSQLERSL